MSPVDSDWFDRKHIMDLELLLSKVFILHDTKGSSDNTILKYTFKGARSALKQVDS